MLPLGQVESLATPGADYQLCFTPGLLAKVYTRQLPEQAAAENLLPDPSGVLGSGNGGRGGGGYTNLDSNGSWWKSTGQVRFVTDTSLSPAQELAEVRSLPVMVNGFYIPYGFVKGRSSLLRS